MRDEQPAHLGGEGVGVTGAVAQRGAEPPLRQAETVVGRGVERADAGVPGGVHRGTGGLVGDRLVEVAEGGAAQRQLRDRHRAGAQPGGPHDRASGRSRSPCIPPSTASAVPVTDAAAGLAR